MKHNEDLQVVFGTGALGTAVIEELFKHGKTIRAVNRSGKADLPEGVEITAGDARDIESTRLICRGATVVYNCVGLPYKKWTTHFPAIQSGIIEGAASANARLISAENTYMYGEVDGPQTEDLPYRATTKKGRVRAEMAEDLMAAHKSGKVRAAIGRASDFYGPGVLNSFAGERVFYPIIEGKKVNMIGSLDQPHTYASVKDFAKGLVTLGEREKALGEVWHIPCAETLTTRQFLELAFDVAGEEPKMGTIPGFLFQLLKPFVPIIREVDELRYEFDKPFIVDHSKFEKAFGAETTPHRKALEETIAWYRNNPR